MLIILIIAFLVLITGIIISKKKGFSDGCDWTAGGWLTVIGGCVFGMMLFVTLVTASFYPDVIATDKKIAMYQEENTKIESQLAVTVSEYMKYEQQTFENSKPNVDKQDVVAFVSLYPELKSDELVKEQIKVYTSNNNEIKRLKAKRIDYEKKLWYLCFYNIG